MPAKGGYCRWVDIFERHPEIAAGRVVAPVFILGMIALPKRKTEEVAEALDPLE